jgi:dynein heavy chain, axonemal
MACDDSGIPVNPVNLMQQQFSRTKNNTHIIFAMSPLGEEFQTRLRMFPSLVNICTIDWFTQWPEEALLKVGQRELMVRFPEDNNDDDLTRSDTKKVSSIENLDETDANAAPSRRSADHVTPEMARRLSEVMKSTHKHVEYVSALYKEEFKRNNYVTPTSYLELIKLFYII